jgi:two-component system sensor histidine kinase/response regulator
VPGGAAARDSCVSAPPGPVVDVSRALERVGGERALLGELVEIFLQELPGRLQRIRDGAGRGSTVDVQRIAHDLKGSLATLGARRCSALAGSLEDACREARTEAIASLLSSLEAELEQVRAFFAAPGWAGDPRDGA